MLYGQIKIEKTASWFNNLTSMLSKIPPTSTTTPAPAMDFKIKVPSGIAGARG